MYRGVPPVVSKYLDIEERRKIYGYHEEHLSKSKPIIDTSRPPEVPRLIIHERNRAILREKQKANDYSNLYYVRDLRKSNMRVRSLTYGGSQTSRDVVSEPSWLQTLEMCEKKVSFIPDKRKSSTIEKRTYVQNKDLFGEGNSKIHDDDGFSVIDEIPVLRTSRSKTSARTARKSPPRTNKQETTKNSSPKKVKVTKKSQSSLSMSQKSSRSTTKSQQSHSPQKTSPKKVNKKSPEKQSDVKEFPTPPPEKVAEVPQNNTEIEEKKRINFEMKKEQPPKPTPVESFSLTDAINRTMSKNQPQNTSTGNLEQPQEKSSEKLHKEKEESFNSGFSGSFSTENKVNKGESDIRTNRKLESGQNMSRSNQASTFDSSFASSKVSDKNEKSSVLNQPPPATDKSNDNFEDDFSNSHQENQSSKKDENNLLLKNKSESSKAFDSGFGEFEDGNSASNKEKSGTNNNHMKLSL
ncbi:hypothetical protein TVAG_346630, partial [Trichomonas vaginalis G3]